MGGLHLRARWVVWGQAQQPSVCLRGVGIFNRFKQWWSMNSLSLVVRVFALLALALVLANGAAWAQEATGKIIGTITDPTGGVIPDAKVTVTNVATQVSRETATDREGYYQVLSLPIGTYRVTVEHAGFRKAVVDTEALRINQTLRVDIQLELGSPTETVEVRGEIAGVETASPTLGQSVTLQSVAGLPLNGRNVYDLALLMPGVTETNPGSPGQFSIAGGRADSVTFLLDGGVNNNLLSNLVVFNPNPDMIAEFRILTSNYTAEYGRNAGGIVSAVTRSGANVYHGSVFEFARNDVFNANSFFNNRDGLPKEILKRHQFGFTVGGPISIPKVLNGKDRFFFYVGYQGQRQTRVVTNPRRTVYTPQELAGDFSHESGDRPGGVDPDVAAFLGANPFFQPDSAKAARAIIDPSRINSVAQKYITAGLIRTAPNGEFTGQGSGTDDRDELTERFDFVVTSKDKIAATLGSSRNPVLVPFSSTFDVLGFSHTNSTRTYFANIGYTRTQSATLLNEFRFTTQRRNGQQSVPAKDFPKPADLGIKITPDEATGPTRLDFFSDPVVGFSPQGPTDLIDNTFVFSDTLSWTRGKHNWKFGGTFSPYQNNTVFDFFVNGEFVFSGPFGIGSGNDFADFLFGLPDEYFQFGSAPSDIRTKSYYGFAQDEWHVLKNLTLTLGIRYEYSSPKLDTKGRSFSLNRGQRSIVFPNAPIGVLFPGDPGAPLGANFADRNDWAPRFGFAWAPFKSRKLSIRGGFGVFYDILKGEDNLQFNGQAPFFGFSDFFFDPLASNPSSEVRILGDPYGVTGTPNPFPSKPPPTNLDFGAAGFLPIGGSGVFYVDPHLRTPYAYQYNLSIQREVVRNLIWEVNYVGTSAHKLTSLVDANPFVLGTSNRLFNTTPGNEACPSFNGLCFSFLPEFRNISNASYNSVEVSVQRQMSDTRFLGRTFFTFAYTYGHSIDNASGFRQRGSSVPAYNSKQFRGSSDYDITHRVTFSGGWDLPFDRGPWSGVKAWKLFAGGWSIYPIFTYRSGFPLDVFAGFNSSSTAAGPSGAGDRDNVRANLVGTSVGIFDPRQSQTFRGRKGNYWFDPLNVTQSGFPSSSQAIADPSVRTYGTLPRNFFRGPTRWNVNFAIAKNTPLYGERVHFLFRAEFFNLFNNPQFANPSTSITSSLLGQITSTADPRIIQFAGKITF